MPTALAGYLAYGTRIAAFGPHEQRRACAMSRWSLDHPDQLGTANPFHRQNFYPPGWSVDYRMGRASEDELKRQDDVLTRYSASRRCSAR
jgi:hypothetical protein